MIKIIKYGIDSFFFEHNQARKTVYASIFFIWLIILVLKASSPTLKQIGFAAVGYPVVGFISYFFMKLSLSSIYLFTKKIGIYQLTYWYGLLGAVLCLITMLFPNSEMYGEASLGVIFFVTVAWVSRSTYFDFKEQIKKKN
jgi:hypothetical protein